MSPASLAIPSVVKKDTTPTDAPRGTWPFSVDSDSLGNQLTAAQQVPASGMALDHPQECALDCSHASLGATLAGAGRQMCWGQHSAGLCLSVYHFAVILFFLRDMCSISVPRTSIVFRHPSLLPGTARTSGLWGERVEGRAGPEQFQWKPGSSPQGLTEHLGLQDQQPGPVYPPCPAEFPSCAYQCELNEVALQGKLRSLLLQPGPAWR